MFRKLGVTGLVLASALAVLGPQVASARDRDDYRYSRDAREARDGREWRERTGHEREEWREHERREDRRYYGRGNYANGYYDQFGYWHPYGY